jgi:hypothetical protein
MTEAMMPRPSERDGTEASEDAIERDFSDEEELDRVEQERMRDEERKDALESEERTEGEAS